MKKTKIALLVTFSLLTFGCGKTESKLLFSDTKSEKLIEIGQIDEDTKIFATTEINYNVENENISLTEALNTKKTTIEEIISKMEIDLALNDGGTLSYKYKKNKDNFANKDFYLVKCNKLNSERVTEEDSIYINQNIYIDNYANSESIFNYCNIKNN